MSNATHVLERSIRTRGYELDQDGLVPPATLLRYMELLRWASMEGDSPLELGRIFRPGERYFVVAAQRLQLERDVGIGVVLSGELSIGRVGRTSLEFRHLFRLAEGGETVARGSVAAVLLGEDARPTPLVGVVRQQALELSQQGWADGGSLDTPEAPADDDVAGGFRHDIAVRHSDTDLLGHANHASYLAYADDTRRLCAGLGGYGDAAAGGRLRSVSLDYRREARAGQTLSARTWVIERAPLTLAVVLSSSGEPVCRCALRPA